MQEADERLQRERAYHNERFTEEVRVHQDKYYYALGDLNADYQSAIRAAANGADVLEYGCAKGDWSVLVARDARSLLGIDISDVAIGAATKAAAEAGLCNARFAVMNAEAMDLPDESLDLVYGSGILHHLDLDRAYGEIARVLRKGGKAVFKEPLGHNLLINLYRAVTPSARTPDEHPLLKADMKNAERHFAKVEFKMYGVTTLASVPFRNTPLGSGLRRLTSAIDKLVTRTPGLRWQAWYALMILEK